MLFKGVFLDRDGTHPHLKGKEALLQTRPGSHNELRVSFGDITLSEAYGWHTFGYTEFDITFYFEGRPMKPVYQTTGADRNANGNCFQACLATLLGRKLDEVPNFMADLKNGETLSDAKLQMMKTWLKGVGCGGYIEFGFNLSLNNVMNQMSKQSPDCFYILTGCTRLGKVHSVVCRGDYVLHDPATSPGHTVVERACNDGFFRVGFLLHGAV